MCRMRADGDMQAGNGGWGWAGHAQQVAYPPANMWRWPCSGGNNDNAHPPIHPTQYANPGALSGQEKSVYEFICRSFLACAPSVPVPPTCRILRRFLFKPER